MTDLDKLIAAVEAGDDTDRIFEAMPNRLLKQWGYILKAYIGSLDAAKALHDALLPGWRWNLWQIGGATVWMDPAKTFRDDNADPARAWLLAILRAYRAQQEAGG